MSLLSKFEGCLLGLAIGDSIGAPVEGFSKGEIERRFGRVEDMMDAPWRRFKKGGITDDTSLMLCIARSISERGEFDPEDAARRFAGWFLEDGYGIGRTTFLAIRALLEGASWRDAGRIAHHILGGMSAGNGSIMRCAPIALRYFKDTESLKEASHLSSMITHYDMIAREACFALNLFIALLLRRGEKNVLPLVIPHITEERTRKALLEIKDLAKEDLRPTAFSLDTLKCSIWVFLNTESFRDAVIEAVNLGGDADTTGAVTGAIAGAFYGREGIPEGWIEELKVRDEILSLARRIYEISGGQDEGRSRL